MSFTLEDLQNDNERRRPVRPEENSRSVARAYRKLLAGVLCAAIEDADGGGDDAGEARAFLREWGDEYCRCIYILGGTALRFKEFLAQREDQWALPADSIEVDELKWVWKRLRQAFKANGERPSLSRVTRLPAAITAHNTALLAHRLRWVLRTLARSVDEGLTTLAELETDSCYQRDTIRTWLYDGHLPSRPAEVVARLTPIATKLGHDIAVRDAEEIHRQLRHGETA